LHPSPTAILIFALSSKEEVTQKSISKGAHLFQALTNTTVNKVQKTGLPYFLISENEQRGTDFGERFTNAIKSVFDLGYTNIITIGNDTPQLKTTHLLKAAKMLSVGKTTLGPSIDGGFYLLGMQKATFNVAEFQKLPWQKESLLHSISNLLSEKLCNLHFLPKFFDIDSLLDIENILSSKAVISSYLIKILLTLLHIQQRALDTITFVFHNATAHIPNNKGSPSTSLAQLQ